MSNLLANIELSEGIIETINWWLPYLIIILIIVIILVIVKRKK